MAKKITEVLTKKPKLRKDICLSNIVGKDVDAIIEHYQDEQRIEICEHLIKTFDDVVEFFKNDGSDEVYRVYANRENELLKKYGKEFKPYVEKKYTDYLISISF